MRQCGPYIRLGWADLMTVRCCRTVTTLCRPLGFLCQKNPMLSLLAFHAGLHAAHISLTWPGNKVVCHSFWCCRCNPGIKRTA